MPPAAKGIESLWKPHFEIVALCNDLKKEGRCLGEGRRLEVSKEGSSGG